MVLFLITDNHFDHFVILFKYITQCTHEDHIMSYQMQLVVYMII